MEANTPDVGARQGRGDAVPDAEYREKLTRRSFLRIAFAAFPAAAVLFVAGCGGEEQDNEDEGEDD